MPKMISFRKGLISVLFWSIISAAFIGPGTVTTASKAGSSFQMELIWALVFSIFATVILQEASARVAIASGKNFGRILFLKFKTKQLKNLRWFLFIAVAFGCAAYEAGNMLGALSGLAIFSDIPRPIFTLCLAALSAALLWTGNFRLIANILGLVVALMGVAFIYVALQTEVRLVDMVQPLISPRMPEGSFLLVIALVGTTIVPYNLFLASGISSGQSIKEMRVGISLAVIIGGIISIAIMIVGTRVAGSFSFEALGKVMSDQMGAWASVFFGIGLFAAGMSSSITAPLAAAVTAKSLLGDETKQWSVRSVRFRSVWGIILLTGLVFGLLDVRPVPAIILAQALNGILLPVVTIFLLLAVNDRQLLGDYVNSRISNFFTLIIVGITCFLGLNNIWKALSSLFESADRFQGLAYISCGLLSVLIVLLLGRKIMFDSNEKEMP